MASDAAGVSSEEPGGLFPRVSSKSTTHSSSSIGDSKQHFREEWDQLREQMVDNREATEVDARLSRKNLERALDLSIQYPNYVEISSRPFDENQPDMVQHVQTHFDNAFNKETLAPRFSVPRQRNYELLIRTCEILYLDDAVLRFSPQWIFEPSLPNLDTLTFNELPERLAQWMDQAQLLWDALYGIAELSDDQTVGLIESLYGSRKEFVTEAIDMDLFLPIPPRDYDSSWSSPNLGAKFTRGHEIEPYDVHRSIYQKVLSEY